MKATVLSVDGKPLREIDVPFEPTQFLKEEVVRKAVLAEESLTYQPKGAYRWAGLETSAEYRGRKDDNRSMKNRGMSRLPRELLPLGRWGRVRIVPFAVKGRRAHPPKTEKKIREKINKKEWKVALHTAITASCIPSIVMARGHRIPSSMHLPIVVEDAMQNISKAQDVHALLEKLHLLDDVRRAEEGRRPRKSVFGGKRRGGYRTPRSVLFVVKGDVPLADAVGALPGVECVNVSRLRVSDVAPGTHLGRLIVWSESALKEVSS